MASSENNILSCLSPCSLCFCGLGELWPTRVKSCCPVSRRICTESRNPPKQIFWVTKCRVTGYQSRDCQRAGVGTATTPSCYPQQSDSLNSLNHFWERNSGKARTWGFSVEENFSMSQGEVGVLLNIEQCSRG